MAKKNFWMNVLKNILNVLAVFGIYAGSSIIAQFAGNFFSDWFYLNIIVCTVLYLALLLGFGILYAKKVLKMDLNEIGISFSSAKKLGKENFTWGAVGFLIPCLVTVFYMVFIPGNFIAHKSTDVSGTVINAVFQIGLWAGIGEEFVMRGIIYRYMKRSFGTVASVLIPAILFALLHVGNMQEFNAIDFLQLLISGTAVAVMLSLMAEKTNSLYPGIFFHTFWNILIIGSVFGIGDIVNGVENSSIIQYRLSTSNHLLTGGNFGIEVALPAIVAYVGVSVFLFILIRKEIK